MSEEMAVNDNARNEDSKMNTDEAVVAGVEQEHKPDQEPPTEFPTEKCEEPLKSEDIEVKLEPASEYNMDDVKFDIKEECNTEMPSEDMSEESSLPEDDKRGVKRRASTALSDIDEGEEFKGFDGVEEVSLVVYNKVVERLEAEVTEAIKSITPLRSVRASSTTSIKASKRPRQDTDGSRPSSALSSRSDGDGAISTDASMSPLSGAGGGRGGRRSTVEMSSPLLRVPLERGWRRELVYRAALDAHSRRNADIYYYSPAGKKLRSTREVAEHLAGTGLTLDNFSFFKEPLGIDDPEKEIIRDAKVMRRVESPVPSAPPQVEGKRTPKPKPPKGASPEPTTPKSPPAKLKFKSMGARLSNNNAATPTAVTPKQVRKAQPQQPGATAAATAATPATAVTPAASPAPTPATAATTPAALAATQATVDNNNTTAWKKPRTAPAPSAPRPPPASATPPTPEARRQLVQPCSMTCGRGVPSLACAACLCLYHPMCVGLTHVTHDKFYCKNCRKSTSPPTETPAHKPGCSASQPAAASAALPGNGGTSAAPRRVPVPVPVPVPAKVARGDKRVLLRMKVAGGGPDGSRLWAVTKGPNTASTSSTSLPTPTPPTTSAAPPAAPKPSAALPAATLASPAPVQAMPPRPTLPQSLAVLNGRRFIVVPRALVQAANI